MIAINREFHDAWLLATEERRTGIPATLSRCPIFAEQGLRAAAEPVIQAYAGEDWDDEWDGKDDHGRSNEEDELEQHEDQ